ncbi:MAG: Gamma-glutamyltranspeptidase [Acidimicrobiales bacterium]|nr:Gamma-glutamyltranspeptidase [Acidimicrobiales bacterium]
MRNSPPSRRHPLKLGLAAMALLLAGLATSAPGRAALPIPNEGCVAADPDGHEPPCNPYMAPSLWSVTHRTSYDQSSSPLPGTTGPADQVNVAHKGALSIPIGLTFSPRYGDGKRVIWTKGVSFGGEVLKVDPETLDVIDAYIPQIEEHAAPSRPSISDVYPLLDSENHFIAPHGASLEIFGDADQGRRDSAIALLRRFAVPPQALCRPQDEEIHGINLTYDGRVVFITNLVTVGVVPRQPDQMKDDTLVTYSINGARCADPSVKTEELEQVSNSVAADEQGAIYAVTSAATYRIDLDGQGLRLGWRTEYQSTGGGSEVGPGSGSTPTLMGSGTEPDRLVAITDAQPLMHLVLMWRDGVPAGWTPIGPGRDPRIACEVPVTFGDPHATQTLSEQSVTVRGYASVLTNNLHGLDPLSRHLPSPLSASPQLLTNAPPLQPKGAERIDWDPVTHTCRTVWANPDISIPNAIPGLSAATGQVYGIGARNGNWTLEALDFNTGRSLYDVEAGPLPSEDSFFAATEVGPDDTVWTGNSGGMTRFRQCHPPEACGVRLSPVDSVIGPPSTDLPRQLVGVPNNVRGAAPVPPSGPYRS